MAESRLLPAAEVSDAVSAGFRAKVSELVDAAVSEFGRSGRDPWMVFAEHLTSHLLDDQHARRVLWASDECVPGLVRVGEIAEPRVLLPSRPGDDDIEQPVLPGC